MRGLAEMKQRDAPVERHVAQAAVYRQAGVAGAGRQQAGEQLDAGGDLLGVSASPPARRRARPRRGRALYSCERNCTWCTREGRSRRSVSSAGKAAPLRAVSAGLNAARRGDAPRRLPADRLRGRAQQARGGEGRVLRARERGKRGARAAMARLAAHGLHRIAQQAGHGRAATADTQGRQCAAKLKAMTRVELDRALFDRPAGRVRLSNRRLSLALCTC